MGQFKYGRNFKGKVVIWSQDILEQVVHNAPINTLPFSYHHTYVPSLYFSIFLSHPPTKAHTPTHSSSLYFSHSFIGKPAIYHHFWWISSENPIRNPIRSIISNFKGKTLTILVAFQVVVRFLSNLSYLSDIHVIEYMGFWFGVLNC